MKRAVITGFGIISSIGNNKEEVLASLKAGKSGIEVVPEFIEMKMRSHVAGTIKLDPSEHIDRKVYRFMGDAAAYAYLSMREAIEDSGLTEDQVSNDRTGLVIGAGTGSAHNQLVACDAVRGPRGVKAIGPYAVTKTMASSVSACLATPYKIRGVNYSISSACATSAHCIGHAVELIQLGKQDVVFAGGAEELSWDCATEFDAMGAISTKYNDTPDWQIGGIIVRHWLFRSVLSRVYVYFFRLLLGFYKSLASCCAVPGVNETDGIGRCVESNMIQLLIIHFLSSFLMRQNCAISTF